MIDTQLPGTLDEDLPGPSDLQPASSGDGVQFATPGPDDVQPVEYEWLNRALTALITIGPMVALGFVGWQMWDGLLHRSDLIVFAILYLLTGLGMTVGFHRLFTHRSFKTYPAVRGVLAVLGSAAIEGPIISWVADHRKHHAFSDKDGDPHSPHVDHGVGLRARCAASPTPTSAGCASTPSAARASATPPT